MDFDNDGTIINGQVVGPTRCALSSRWLWNPSPICGAAAYECIGSDDFEALSGQLWINVPLEIDEIDRDIQLSRNTRVIWSLSGFNRYVRTVRSPVLMKPSTGIPGTSRTSPSRAIWSLDVAMRTVK